MRISIYTLVRLTCFVTMLATMSGVAANRLKPNSKPFWKTDHNQPWTVGQHLFNPYLGKGLILNTRTELNISLPESINENLDLISISPFQDDDGNRAMVCRSQIYSGKGTELAPGPVQLARYSFPDNQFIEQRETDWLPSSLPAWDLRTNQGLRCVFSTGAGQLIRVDWTDSENRKVHHRGQEIQWSVEPPFGPQTFIAEPSWIPDSQNPDRLLVSIWGLDNKTHQSHVGIAWIELDASRDAIVDYGLITDSVLSNPAKRIYSRFPTAKLDRSGKLQLFWYERQGVQREWDMYTTELNFVSASNSGLGIKSPRLVTTGCLAVPIGFSQDSDYVYFVVPNSSDCYDGGTWRKTRFQASGPVLVASNAPKLEVQTTGKKAR